MKRGSDQDHAAQLDEIRLAMLAWSRQFGPDDALEAVAGIIEELAGLVGAGEVWTPGTSSRADLLDEVRGKVHFIATGRQRKKRGSYAEQAERLVKIVVSAAKRERDAKRPMSAAVLADWAHVLCVIFAREARTIFPKAPGDAAKRRALFEMVAEKTIAGNADLTDEDEARSLVTAWAKECGFPRPSKMFDAQGKREKAALSG